MHINRIRIDYVDAAGDNQYEIFELTPEQAGRVSEVGVNWNGTKHIAKVYIATPRGERIPIHNENQVFKIIGMSAYNKE